ncbi:MAG TPA: outer membrane beta-barrel protein [Phnomibacter sp.]|nr:outer membrane beta-barrel protein [Phnomibacter sp.]
MKKLIAVAIGLCTFLMASAQFEAGRIFKPFKVDLSIGYALPVGKTEGTNFGMLFVVEPKYAVTEQVAVGLRMESAVLLRSMTEIGEDFEGLGQANGSYLLTGDYYFSENNFRPFLGLGAGYMKVSAGYVNTSESINTDDFVSAGKFGFMLRGGFEARHFRMGLEYNVAGKTDFSPNNNYLGIKMGICIGGGRYEK